MLDDEAYGQDKYTGLQRTMSGAPRDHVKRNERELPAHAFPGNVLAANVLRRPEHR